MRGNQVGQINIVLLNDLIAEKKVEGRVVPSPIPEMPSPAPRKHKARVKAKDRRRDAMERARKRDQANDNMSEGLQPWVQQNRKRKSWSQ